MHDTRYFASSGQSAAVRKALPTTKSTPVLFAAPLCCTSSLHCFTALYVEHRFLHCTTSNNHHSLERVGLQSSGGVEFGLDLRLDVAEPDSGGRRAEAEGQYEGGAPACYSRPGVNKSGHHDRTHDTSDGTNSVACVRGNNIFLIYTSISKW